VGQKGYQETKDPHTNGVEKGILIESFETKFRKDGKQAQQCAKARTISTTWEKLWDFGRTNISEELTEMKTKSPI